VKGVCSLLFLCSFLKLGTLDPKRVVLESNSSFRFGLPDFHFAPSQKDNSPSEHNQKQQSTHQNGLRLRDERESKSFSKTIALDFSR